MFARHVVACWLLLVAAAWAGGPRFVTGSQFSAVGSGRIMAFRTNQPLYFTDAGGLGADVTHAQADAMVAAAAAVWNVPTASLVLAQGGVLAEDVSGANTYLGNTGVVWPADVMASNDMSVPIAVVYDADGSVTDLLLGDGASDPAGCRQTGVTESVDAFGQAGTIDHAILIVNGRCVSGGAAQPQQMLQLQYQLARAFGRVLGLAWSQLNDNVFTGATPATLAERQNWPLMHPIDIICGPYSYQCTVSPFTLREDDVSALDLLYPVTSANVTTGKTITWQTAVGLEGWLRFPTGQGMDELNVVVTRNYAGTSYVQPWEVASGVTGALEVANVGNPVTGPAPLDTQGALGYDPPALFTMGRVDVGSSDATLWLTTEAINPLYVGAYAIGPYMRPPTTPSGPSLTMVGESERPGYVNAFVQTMGDAASTCSPNDGDESSPVGFDPSGWLTGLLCGVGHTSWWSATVKAGRSWTVEVTALDETGNATTNKAQPVVGVWNAGDPTGTLPTVASQGFAMNSMVLGMTQLPMDAGASDATVRIAVADQFGDGRPDFAYNMRVLYADAVAPSQVGATGGQIVITGTGFCSGNRVTVNGVAAAVVSWSATQIVAVAPSIVAVGASAGVAVDVGVVDAGTGGSTVISGALTYVPGVQPVYSVSVSNAPVFVAAGAVESWAVALTAMENGVAAVGVPVAWTASGLSLASSQGVTNAGGVATVSVSSAGVPVGVDTVTGCSWVSVCASWVVTGVDASQWQVTVVRGAGQSVAVGGALAPVILLVTDAVGDPLQGATVTVYQDVQAWEGVCPVQGRCAAAPVLASSMAAMVSDANGNLQVTPLVVAGQPQVINFVATTGTAGFVSMSLTVTP